jgi:hypothetical protein
MTEMTTEISTATEPGQELAVEEKINQLRELFADAPEVGKKALENVLSRLASDASTAQPPPVQSAGRVGSRPGKVSELTIIVPFAPGEAQRLRAFSRLFGGNLDNFHVIILCSNSTKTSAARAMRPILPGLAVTCWRVFQRWVNSAKPRSPRQRTERSSAFRAWVSMSSSPAPAGFFTGTWTP